MELRVRRPPIRDGGAGGGVRGLRHPPTGASAERTESPDRVMMVGAVSFPTCSLRLPPSR